ncbi:MAG: hypothetical protein ABS91_00645 [Thiobacillus sp. SCN 64-35]|nr:MAG: hypothetical protein ABS91_00645 [Thiobacillus sp. SCN 64-35]
MAQALVLSQTPLFLQGSVQPQTMLTVSKDQQLYKKAYNDYSDLDNDGQIETTYKHSIDYYGYFDPQKCYVYSSTNKRFEPTSVSTTKYCSGQWSGNFLNWASMARMDAVRKLLYGGMRSPARSTGDGAGLSDGDTATGTVLERVYLPTDAHAWAKYYNGTDIGQLTPYTPPATDTTSTTSRTITNTGSNTVSYTFTLASAAAYANGNIVEIMADANNYLRGNITSKSGSNITISVANGNYGGSGTFNSWTVRNLSTRGITLCNTTLGGTGVQSKSQTNTNLPRMRVAAGNFSLWNANERWQCYWSGEKSASNSNDYALSGIPAASSNPTLATHGTGAGLGDYFVRIQACVAGLEHKEKCNRYPDGNYKPVGLLQVYGNTDQIHFGLLTGSYERNISGGVLRKNVGTFTDEVNRTTDGTFTSLVGIVRTLDRMRIYGYNYDDGTYLNSAGDNCGFQLTNITQGNCTSWGNPMSESYYEALRYFAGASGPTAAYDYTDAGSKDNTLGLPKPSWVPSLSQVNYCAPLNNLVFNASVSTNDIDLASTTMSEINSSSTASALADLVGAMEGIHGNTYFIGASGISTNELCNGKTVSNLGSIYGICPEGPTLLGSYLMPGMAYHARVNPIRTDLTVPMDDKRSLKVATYGIQLATNVPRIPIAYQGQSPSVILQPIYRLNNSSPQGGGALVDMKIVSQTATSTVASGTVYVNWEDSEQGGDYDQDMWGLIKYCMTSVANGCGAGTAAGSITVTTDAIAESTNQPQGFGYVVSGTTQDGAHFHSGIEGFNYTDPTGVLGCTNCQLNNAPTSVTYTLGTSLAQPLEDPLYYAAKYGGFSDANNNKLIDAKTDWDVLKTDGTAGSDDIPDNYFLVNNPLGLEIALNNAFLKILKDSSASAVATNSSSLNTGSRIFQGRFSNNTWSGQLLSYRLSPSNGSVISAPTVPHALWDAAETPYPEWDAGQKIMMQVSASADSRLILTTGNGGVGVDFQYPNLTAGSGGQQAILNRDFLANADNCGPERVAFLRGHTANTGTGTFTCALPGGATIQRFRERPVSVLGDIVNSNPIFVGAPNAGYSDIDHPGYTAFTMTFAARKPVVYVGANDGMLHGFDVSVDTSTNLPKLDAGKEVIAYVPSMVYDNLSRLTDVSYSGNTTLSNHHYFVDASPMVADVCTANCTLSTATWKTLLVGGLGGGGRGYFALNVTNPDLLAHNTANTPLFDVSRAEDIVEWEFTSGHDADLGYTFNSAPTKLNNGQARQIAKFQNGRWGVVVGNGYNSSNGKAVLYILFMEGPTGTGGVWQASGIDYVRIEADAGPNNGLSTPIPFDTNGDGLVDTVYAGDLQGNMWKFNIASLTTPTVSKLYSARDASNNPQPIVNSPEVTLHPSGGTMVLFGTGKYLESGDNSSTAVQTFYGIRDIGMTVSGRNALIPMVVSTTTNPRDTVSTGCVGPCPNPNYGWFMDLPSTGERATGSPDLVSGIVFFNTFIPSTSPCEFGGTGWLMAVSYLDGSLIPATVFDSNQDGKIDVTDFAVAGMKVGAALGGTTLIKGNAASPIGVGVSSTTSGSTPSNLINFGAGSSGRITWREIVQ